MAFSLVDFKGGWMGKRMLLKDHLYNKKEKKGEKGGK